MKRSRFSEEQIIGTLKDHEAGFRSPTCAEALVTFRIRQDVDR